MEYNDFELVSLAQDGNEDARNIIYQKYKPIIVKKSKNAIMYANHHGIEINDIMQEGYIALEEAISNFSQKDNATFYTFANICIDRQIVNYLRKTTQGKNKILNDAIFIDETIEGIIHDDRDIESDLVSKDINDTFLKEIQNILTDFEFNVFKLKLNGYSFEEIAKNLNRDIKSIYNTFHRVKLKVRKLSNNDNYL